MIYQRLFEKGSMKAQLRLIKGTMKALSMHDRWNSGSIHVYRLLMHDYRASTMHNDKIDLFPYCCVPSHRTLSHKFVVSLLKTATAT